MKLRLLFALLFSTFAFAQTATLTGGHLRQRNV